MRYRYLVLVLAILVCTRVAAQNETPPLDNVEVISVDNVDRLEETAIIGRGTISNAVWSPDGATIAVAGSRGIWLYAANDLETLPRLLTGHIAPVSTLAFSPDSQLLASGSTDEVQVDPDIRIWDVESGELLETLRGHTDSIGALAFSPEGDYLVSGGWQQDKTVRVWRRTQNEFEMVASVEIPSYFGATDIAFRPNSDEIAFAFSDNRRSDGAGIFITHLENLLDGNPDFVYIDGSSVSAYSVSFHPEAPYLAYGTFVEMGVWDVENQTSIYKGQPVYALPIYDVTYSPDGSTLAIALYNREIHLWDARTNEEQRIIRWGDDLLNPQSNRPPPPPYHVEFSPDSTRLLSALPDNTIRIWDVQTGDLLTILDGFTPAVATFAFTSSTEMIAAGTDQDGNLLIWNNMGETTLIPVEETNGVFQMELSPNGAYLVYITSEPDNNHSAVLYNTQTSDSFVLTTQQGELDLVSLSTDGSLVALYRRGAAKALEFWNVNTRQQANSFNTSIITPDYSPAYMIFDAALSSIFIASPWDIELYRLNMQTEQVQSTFQTEHVITAIELSPDTSLIALAVSDRYENIVEIGQVEIFDVATGERVYTLVGHSDWIDALMFSPSGDLLITGSWDRSIRFWDVSTGEQIATRISHTDDVTHLALNVDGTLLASGSADGTVHTWGIPIGNDG